MYNTALFLATAAAVLCAALVLEECRLEALEKVNKALNDRLSEARAREKLRVKAETAEAHSDIAALQMEIFMKNERISELQRDIKHRDQLLQQKWADARGE